MGFDKDTSKVTDQDANKKKAGQGSCGTDACSTGGKKSMSEDTNDTDDEALETRDEDSDTEEEGSANSFGADRNKKNGGARQGV